MLGRAGVLRKVWRGHGGGGAEKGLGLGRGAKEGTGRVWGGGWVGAGGCRGPPEGSSTTMAEDQVRLKTTLYISLVCGFLNEPSCRVAPDREVRGGGLLSPSCEPQGEGEGH